MADPQKLRTDFEIAVKAEGAPYGTARNAIIEQGQTAVAPLDLERRSGDWKRAWIATTLIGWVTERELYERCTQYVMGDIPGPKPITGYFPARLRIPKVAALGERVTPRLLEMALKTQELGDAIQTETIFGSLVALKDARAVPALIDGLEHSKVELVREWSASTLGALHDTRAVQPLLRVLRNRAEPEMLRASAAMSLGQLGAREALPDLRTAAGDVTANLGYRKAAVSAIGDLGDAASADDLLRTLASTADETFQLLVLFTVRDIGAANVLPQLGAIERAHSDEAVRDAAKEAREAIEERVGAKH